MFQLKVSHNRGCRLGQVLLFLNFTHFNLQRPSGSVTHISTTSTRVCNKFVGVQTCALSTGDVVVYGGTTDYKFHVYASDGKSKETTFSRLCDHWITILSLLIENVEYLCVACEECRNIKLINLVKEERPFIAYTGNTLYQAIHVAWQNNNAVHVLPWQKMPLQVLPRQQMPKTTFSQPYITIYVCEKD